MKRLLIGLLLLSGNIIYAQNLTQDSLALVDLYNSTNGPGWTNKTNWLQPGTSVATWYGVTVSSNRVTQLNLSDNQVIGTLPSTIAVLTELTTLHIRGNQIAGLSGPIPFAIGYLTKLVSVDLARNFLTGPFPTSFANLTLLQNLALDANSFGGPIPPEIFSLTSLTNLSMSACQFTGSISPQIGNLTNLVTLNFIANQLSGPIPDQIGSLTNLQQLYLNSNQLTGSIPAAIGNLNLSYAWFDHNSLAGTVPSFSGSTGPLNLRLQNNLLEDLPTLAAGSYSTLALENNRFTFEDLVPNAGIIGVTYNPQAKTPVPNPNPLVIPGDNYTFVAPIGGTSNQYQWYRNGIPIGSNQATYTLFNAVPVNSGTYFVRATNPGAPGIIIESNPILLTVQSPPAHVADSLTLVAFYNAMNGPGWTNKTNWLMGHVNTWFGVTLDTGGRVKTLALPTNQVRGTVPASFVTLAALTTLNLQNSAGTILPATINQLGSLTSLNMIGCSLSVLPPLAGMTNFTSLLLQNNFLTFEDLEPIASLPGIVYSPQNLFGLGGAANIAVGNPWLVQATAIGGSANQFQWIKTGVPISGATAAQYAIASVTAADAASYQLRVTSPLVPGLTLTSQPHNLVVHTPTAQNYFAWPQNDGIINDTPPRDSYGGYWADIDNDGDDDLAINNLESGTSGRSVDLYENVNGHFTRLTGANMPTNDGGRNMTWADYDNDGDLDFYMGDAGFNLLSDAKGDFYRNNGNKTFTRVPLDQFADGGAWADYDNDGYVDLFTMDAGLTNTVYRNNGNGTFTLAPVTLPSGSEWTLAFADIDNDRDLDLVQVGRTATITNNNLLRNDGGGVYTFLSSSIISTDNIQSARGGSWADIDNDDDMDFFAMNATATGTVESAFYINDGTGNFTKQNASTRLGADVRGRSSVFGDIDNDGDIDLLVHNGRAGNLGVNVYLNNGSGSFTQISAAQQSFIPVGNATLAQASLGDANNDGFLDIFSSTFSILQPPALYRNLGGANKWIKFRLQGTASNRSGVGARIKIYTGSLMQIREVTTQSGLAAQTSLSQHFGIGAAAQIDSVTIYWPSGTIQKLNNVVPNQLLTVTEGMNPPDYTVIPSDSLALVAFYNSMNGANWINKTNWLTGDVNTWYGITVDINRRVTGISLPSNSVSGTMPASFGSLTGLKTLNLSIGFLGAPGLPASFSALTQLSSLNLNSTSLTSLVPIYGLQHLTTLIVTNNSLTFEDLEPIDSIANFQYIPQNPVGPAGLVSNIIQGYSWSAVVPVGGSANQYQWYRGATPVAGATTNTLTFPAVAPGDAGSYQLRITSPLIPGLTLNSQAYTLAVVAPGAQTYFTWPQNDGIINDTPSDSYGGYWADIDNDGDDDLAISNLQNGSTGRSVDLYENVNGVFTRLTSAGMPTDDSPRNISWADYDNDGDLDFYIGDIAFNLLTDFKGAFYRNNGNKTFTKIALDQLADGGTWSDYDNDGLVDLFIMDAGQPTVVYRNLGNGNFALAPVSLPMGADWMLSFADYDNDRDMDFVQVGKTPNSGFNNLFRQDSIGSYSYQSSSIISTENLTFARGGSWADIDNDGDLDFFAMNASTAGIPSTFYINDGSGNFSSQSSTIILGADVRGRASSFGDLDNDGDVDLVVHNGKAGNTGVNVYLNNGSGNFTQVLSGVQSFIPVPNPLGSQVALGDANSDGFLDIFSATFNALQPPALYRNVGNSNKWVKFKLQGTASNRSAIGARIRTHAGGLTQIREITSETGLASQNSLVQHFGLAGASQVDSLTIYWPSGTVQKINNIASNQVVVVTEGFNPPSYTVIPSDSLALVAFYNAMNGANWTNKTNWLTGDVNTWYGITVDGNQRVSGITLPGNNIVGVMPASFTSLTGLQTLNLSGAFLNAPGLPANFSALEELTTLNLNAATLTSLTPILGLHQLSTLIVTNNALTFEDLEPIDSIANFQYVPQNALIPVSPAANIVLGNTWTATYSVGGSANQYQWYKGASPVAGATTNTLNFPAVTAGDAGSYQLRITSPLVPGLTINSATNTLSVVTAGAQTLFTWPQNDGIINDIPSDSYGGYWADIDNDGDDDLAISNLQSGITGRSVDLYENINGVFTRLTGAGMPTDDGPRNISWADYDNDGDLDFYVGDIAFNLLTDFKGAFYRNNGNKTFTKIALDQLADGGTWSDYDKDGLVDLFIVDAGQPTVVYRNLGGGNFALAPVSLPMGADWMLSFADYDNDRDMDFVQVGKTPNSGFNNLFRQDSIGSYSYQSSSIISTDNLQSARGGSWADIDNDGDMDFFAMNSTPIGVPSTFYINDGAGNFSSESSTIRLGADVRGRASSFGDLDNDGDVDLVVHNGLAGNTGVNVYLNNGSGTFSQVLSGVQSFIPVPNSFLSHVSIGDANSDGFLDIFSASFNALQPPALYRNVGNANKWVKFKLQGTTSNRSAIGARIRTHAGGLTQIREITSETGLASQNSLVQHFGLAAASQVDSLTIYWPSGLVQKANNIPAGQMLTIVEGVTPPSYTVVTSDSLVLVAFYNAMNGANWINKTNWLTGDVNTWYGISIANQRVSGIALPNNSVNGIMPASFTSLTGLESLNLSGAILAAPGLPANFSALTQLSYLNLNANTLTSLAPIHDLHQLSTLIVTNNSLTFEDLEPIDSVANFQYIPQNALIPAPPASNIVLGNSWTATYPVGGSANQYQWYKGASPVAGATTNTLNFPAVTAGDAGGYQLRVTSPLVPGLTINSSISTLIVITAGAQTMFTWPQNDGIINTTPSDSYGGYWADIDNDGDDDLAISNLQSGLTGRSVDLYENVNGVFTRLTNAGMPTDDGPRNISWADYDNDGDLDFYVGDIAFNLLTDFKGAFYRNNGNKTFTKIALDQLADGGTWSDYDNDGLVDLFIVDAGQPTVIYRNMGNGNFTLAPVSLPMGADWMLSFADYDNDRDMDFVQVGKTPNSGFNNLFRQDSAGFYSYQSSSTISTEDLTQSRGGSWADIDNDGDLDFFAMNATTAGTPSTFHINDGTGNFSSQSSTVRLGADVRGRASSFGDLDNDGDVDLVVHNGRAGNTGVNVYLNNGSGTFTQVLSGVQSFIPIPNSFLSHVSLGDANSDGFLDIFSASFNAFQPPALYRNVGNSNKWVKFKLQGTTSNRSAIGARIRTHAGGLTQIREITSETGLASQNSLVQHFGLATASQVDSLTIYWPSGLIQKANNIPAGQMLTIVEGVTPPSYTVVTSDSLALVAFYNAMNGVNWPNKTNWLTADVNTWYGITIADQRVTGISLPSNSVSGVMPASFGSLTGLKTLNLSGGFLLAPGLPTSFSALTELTTLNLNQTTLTSLAPIHGLHHLSTLIVTNNALTFEDLEPIDSVATFQYIPQNPIGPAGTASNIVQGNSWTAAVPVGGSANQYQWYKGVVPVAGATSNTLNFPSVAPADAGNYQLRVTSTLVPGLQLNSATYGLAVVTPGAQVLFTWPQNDGIINGTPSDSYGGFWADFDNDGDDDLAISNLQSGLTGRSVDLYENENGVFTRLTSAGMPTDDGPRNISWADYDNDGDLDFYVGDVGFNLLTDSRGAFYLNNGNKTFTKIALDQLADGGTWSDYDNDGLVDLFIVDAGQPTKVYRNLGSGNFALAPVSLPMGADWMLAFADYDNDRDMDFVQVGKTPNSGFNNLFRQDSIGFYSYQSSNIISTEDLTIARGGSWADIDNDGDLDFFAMNASPVGIPSTFYINDGAGNFSSQSSTIRLGADVRGRASSFGDLDNDGDIDLVVHNSRAGNTGVNVYLNNGSGSFTQVLSGVQSFIPVPNSALAHVALGDANSDGFLDIFSATFNALQPPALYRNVGNGNKWVKFNLQGTTSNRSAIGARIRAHAGGLTQIREITSETGLASQNSLVQHFGLAAASQVDSVTIYWPSGTVQKLINIGANQVVTIVEPVGPNAPTFNADSITFTSVYSTQMRINFAAGDGAKRIVVVRPISSVNFTPIDGISYAASSNYATAADLGDGNRIVMADTTSRFVDITGLNPSTVYFVKIFEYNGDGAQAKYLILGAPSASRTTLALPNVFVSTPVNNAVNQNVSLTVQSVILAGATTYTIELNPNPDFSGTSIVRSGSRTQSFTGLTFETTYYSRVKTDLSPDYGQVRTFSTAGPEFFSYVTSPANNATNVALTNLNLSVTANLVIGASLYTIELNTSSDFEGISQVRTGGRTILFLGLSPSTTYYTRVRTNFSPTWGQVRQFTTSGVAALTFVTSPANNATNVSYEPSVTVSDVGATSYTVLLSPTSDFSAGVLDNTSASRTMTFTGLQYNTLYYSKAMTDLDPNFGPVRMFTTNSPLTYSYITSPANNAVNVPYITNITANTVPGATTYTIEANTSADFTGTSITQTGARTQSFTLAFNQVYYVRVQTNLLPGQWGSTIRSFTTNNPVNNTYITSPANNATGVPYVTNITANNVPGATTYTIEANTMADFSGASITQSGARTQSFTLGFDQLYYVRVYTDLSPGNWGPSRSFATNSPLLYSYITSPTNNAVNVPYTTNITANPVPAATTYTIEANTQPDFTGTSVVRTGGRTLNFTLSYNQVYYVRVQTNLLPGQWGSTVRSFTTVSAVNNTYITSPANNATGVPYVTNIVSNNVAGATTYTIEANTMSDFSGASITQTGGRTQSFTLAFDQVYYVRVYTDLAPGMWGATRSFTTNNPLFYSYMSSPVNGATNVSFVTNITANLVPTATFYTIEANTQSNFTGTSIVKMGTGRTYSFTLAADQTYYVRVQTSLMPGQWGPTVRSFTTGNAQSLAFVTSPVNGVIAVPTTVNVTSSVVPGATTYTIELNTNDTFTGASLVLSGAGRTKSFTGLSEATTYFTRVSTNVSGGLWGETRSFTTINPSGRQVGIAWAPGEDEEIVLGQETSMAVRTFPNPFVDQFEVHIQTDIQQPLQVTLTDLNGRVLFESKDWMTNQVGVIKGEFSDGIYLLNLRTGESRRVVKMVKH